MKRGQTLIELMVVAAIFAILAAIIFPVFANAKDKKQRRNCELPPTETTIEVKNTTTDYIDGVPRSSNGRLYGGELYTIVETDQGQMLILSKVKWHDASGNYVTERAKIESPLGAYRFAKVLVGTNKLDEKLIVKFIEGIPQELTDDKQVEDPPAELERQILD